MDYIVLNSDGVSDFNELKIQSGIDFSKNDCRFIPYYDEFLIPESMLDDPTFEDFKTFLQDGGHLDNLEIRDISDEELQAYWESLES